MNNQNNWKKAQNARNSRHPALEFFVSIETNHNLLAHRCQFKDSFDGLLFYSPLFSLVLVLFCSVLARQAMKSPLAIFVLAFRWHQILTNCMNATRMRIWNMIIVWREARIASNTLLHASGWSLCLWLETCLQFILSLFFVSSSHRCCCLRRRQHCCPITIHAEFCPFVNSYSLDTQIAWIVLCELCASFMQMNQEEQKLNARLMRT